MSHLIVSFGTQKKVSKQNEKWKPNSKGPFKSKACHLDKTSSDFTAVKLSNEEKIMMAVMVDSVWKKNYTHMHLSYNIMEKTREIKNDSISRENNIYTSMYSTIIFSESDSTPKAKIVTGWTLDMVKPNDLC